MKNESVRTVGLAMAAVIVLASGVWLTRAGRPYGSLLLNLHKLVDLAAVVVIGIVAYQANRAAPLSTAEWLVVGATAFLVIATFATGGIVSAMHAPPSSALWAHRVGSWVAALLAVASVYVLASR